MLPEVPDTTISMTMPKQSVRQFDLRSHGDLSIAIISDTHGDIDPRILEVVRESDAVLHAGDIMGGEVLERLNPRLGIVIAVRGNNDVSLTRDEHSQDELAAIPEVALVECQGGSIAMEHGHRLAQIDYDHFPLGYKYPDARLVVYGHTHVQRLDQDTQPWLVNPGAAGMVRNQGGASCYQLQIAGGQWSLQRFKFSSLRKTG